MNFPRITFKNKTITISPDPIIIQEEALLEIEVYADLNDFSMADFRKLEHLRWVIKFENGNPFNKNESKKVISFQTECAVNFPIHAAIIELGKAINLGEYKYGISL